MNDFDFDALEKKRIARSAFAHVSFKRGGCTLPSDMMTAKEKKELNGEVKSYNVTRPMLWAEYKALPDDLKREYWRNMQGCGGTAAWLAPLMGIGDKSIINAAKAAGVPFRRGGGNIELWQAAEYKWAMQDVVQDAQERVEGSGECSNTPPGVKPVEPLKTPVTLAHARLVLNGERESILQRLAMLVPDSGEIVVEW